MKVARIIARPSLYFEKLTKPIRVGPLLMVGEKLHDELLQIQRLIGNAPLRSALIMVASEGSPIILEKLLGTYRTNVDEVIQARVNQLLCEFEDSIEACAKANGCDEVAALQIILQIGTTHGRVNGWSKPEGEVQAGKKRA